MVGTRDKKSAVPVKAGAVVAVGAVVVAFLLVACSDAPEPETAPAPSNAPDPDNSVVAEADKAPSPSQTSVVDDDGAATGLSTGVDSEAATEPPAEAPVDVEPESAEPEAAAEPPAEAPVDVEPKSPESVDVEPEFAVEIVEELAPTEAVAGARQDEPVEPVEPEDPDGTGSSGRTPSAQGDVYTWHDGDRMGEARLQLDLVVTSEDAVAPDEDVVADMGDGRIVTRSVGGASEAKDASGAEGASGSDGASSTQPVFLSGSGELMTLPGGVILVLDEDWDSESTDGFFARNGISLDRVSELDYLTNGFFVETEPGFASLDLANALAPQDGVELSSPNWWRERTAR